MSDKNPGKGRADGWHASSPMPKARREDPAGRRPLGRRKARCIVAPLLHRARRRLPQHSLQPGKPTAKPSCLHPVRGLEPPPEVGRKVSLLVHAGRRLGPVPGLGRPPGEAHSYARARQAGLAWIRRRLCCSGVWRVGRGAWRAPDSPAGWRSPSRLTGRPLQAILITR
jgi:hypothetical protein